MILFFAARRKVTKKNAPTVAIHSHFFGGCGTRLATLWRARTVLAENSKKNTHSLTAKVGKLSCFIFSQFLVVALTLRLLSLMDIQSQLTRHLNMIHMKRGQSAHDLKG